MADESVSDLLNGKTMEQASQELSDSLAGDLGAEPTSEEVGASPPASGTQEVKPAAQPEILPEAKAPPKSWKPEWHEHWPKLDPKVQEILEQREADMAAGVEPLKADAALARTFKDVLTPYQPLLDSQGLKDPAYVVRSLLNTHYQLSTFDDAKKAQLFVDLAKLYKVDLQKAVAGLDEVPFINPSLQEVLGRLDKVEGSITAERTAAVNELRSKTMEEVKAFASDPAHTYFNDVADHVVLLLQDPRISLKDAYEQAVWANPATRAKEQTRLQQESEVKLRKDAEEAAAKARKAKGTDVRGKESLRGSTDLLGTMDETLRETYKEVNSRT